MPRPTAWGRIPNMVPYLSPQAGDSGRKAHLKRALAFSLHSRLDMLPFQLSYSHCCGKKGGLGTQEPGERIVHFVPK